MTESKDVSESRVSSVYVQANAENDRVIQKVISLFIKSYGNYRPSSSPWSENFNSVSVDFNGLLYMDHRLVIPKDMTENMLRAIHFGDAGRDAMVREASDIWWPRIYREKVEKAKNCVECRQAGQKLKCIKSQNEFGKLPDGKQPNEELSKGFAAHFNTPTHRHVFISFSGQLFRLARRAIFAKFYV